MGWGGTGEDGGGGGELEWSSSRWEIPRFGAMTHGSDGWLDWADAKIQKTKERVALAGKGNCDRVSQDKSDKGPFR